MKPAYIKAYRAIRGYTLVELIVLLVIIGILIGISVPQAASLIGNYRLHGLDMEADMISLTAQNRLSKLESEDRINELTALSASEGTDGVYFAVFSNSETGEEVLCRDGGAKSSAAFELLYPTSIFDDRLSSGCSVIEYKLNPAIVTRVYYSDKSFDYNYDAVDSASSKTGGTGWEQWRTDNNVGYRAIMDMSDVNTIEYDGRISAEVTVENGEELLVSVVGTADMIVGNFSEYDPADWNLTVTVTGLDSGKSAAFDSSDPAYLPYFKNITGTAGNISYTVYLDGTNGHGFGDLYPTLMSGEDICVAVELYYTGGKYLMKSHRSKSGAVNSLYYSKEDGTENTYYVTNSRHIQNETLNPEYTFVLYP